MARPRFQVQLVGLDEDGTFHGDEERVTDLGSISKTALKKVLRLVRDCPLGDIEGGEVIARAEIVLRDHAFAAEGYDGELHLFDLSAGEEVDASGIEPVLRAMLEITDAEAGGEDGGPAGNPAPLGSAPAKLSLPRGEAPSPPPREASSPGVPVDPAEVSASASPLGRLVIGILKLGVAAGLGLFLLGTVIRLQEGSSWSKRSASRSSPVPGRAPRPPLPLGELVTHLDGLEAASREHGSLALGLALPRLREEVERLPREQRRAAADRLAMLEARAALWNTAPSGEEGAP